MDKDSLGKMQKAVLRLSKDRDWGQFHSPKNMALDLAVETGEVLEHLVWDSNGQIKKDTLRKRKIGTEMADVLHCLLLLADSLKINLSQAFWQKLEEVKKRYPAAEFKGISGYECKKKLKK
jgi:dCTP diphosphatase